MSSLDLVGMIFDAAWRWGLIGSVAFTGMLIIHHFYGPGPDVRDENGKKQIPPEFRVFVAIEMLLIVTIMLGTAIVAIISLRSSWPESLILDQILTGYAVLWIINLWDLVVIDWALVVRFRPKWLEVPDTPYFNTMMPHVTGWLLGNLYMIPFAVLAWWLSTVL